MIRAVPKALLRTAIEEKDFGDHSDGETPVPIPNTAVKPVSADGTGLATVWESRSSPRSFSFARNPAG